MSDLWFCFVLFFSFQSHTQCRCKSIKIINLCGRRLGSKMFELYVKSRPWVCLVGSFKFWKSVESFGCQRMHDPMRRFLIGSCIRFKSNSTPSTEVTDHQHRFHVLQQHFIWNNMDKTAETVWQLTEIILFIYFFLCILYRLFIITCHWKQQRKKTYPRDAKKMKTWNLPETDHKIC